MYKPHSGVAPPDTLDGTRHKRLLRRKHRPLKIPALQSEAGGRTVGLLEGRDREGRGCAVGGGGGGGRAGGEAGGQDAHASPVHLLRVLLEGRPFTRGQEITVKARSQQVIQRCFCQWLKF